MAIEKLDFIGVPSTDVERSRTFYVETLGLREDPDARYEFWVGETCFGLWGPEEIRQGCAAAARRTLRRRRWRSGGPGVSPSAA